SEGLATPSGHDAADERRVAHCIRKAAGGQKWLEVTLWGLRDQEGGWIGAEVRNRNGSHDLGSLQINSWWVPRIAVTLNRSPEDVRHWLRYDPCFNANAARWIFVAALASTGSFWKAVGVYHRPSSDGQKRYAHSVAEHLKRRFGERIFSPSLANKSGGKGSLNK
ncbi:lytic transglycosylase domain-containing protein, partial [Sphingobium sp.]|uniref:lytic transglycosylase domain-containing protein n=1 Tax=Sphingobium sp. TaxID=1912891 RepID=UPI002C6F7AC0